MPHRELPAAASKGQLLDWARGTYGGITSYSELRDPRAIHLRLGEGALGTGAGGEVGGHRVAPGGEEGAAVLSLLPVLGTRWVQGAMLRAAVPLGTLSVPAERGLVSVTPPALPAPPLQMPAAPRTASPRSASTPRRTSTPRCFSMG